MRELDELLLGWFDSYYVQATDAEKAAFEELLTLPDPELARYLLSEHEPAGEGSALVVSQIRSRTRSG